jgi:hypothetical protein
MTLAQQLQKTLDEGVQKYGGKGVTARGSYSWRTALDRCERNFARLDAHYEPLVFNGLQAWGHGGNAPGFAAACFYLPQYNVCIGFLDNMEEGNAMNTIMDLMTVITTHLQR